ncbi:hypothetical protein GCM10010345_94840 [Streptomyces canarius]|uniref:Uncharacterized protein n=1 Tax=Streptomyces canarius TaxID=285453 RepID=A0ABQ3DJ71_9ACTN|nr:hypothetical protein GCM10010345_94840 [Streptomyces canarius]
MDASARCNPSSSVITRSTGHGRARQDASDGDLPGHLVVGEHHARPDRNDPVPGRQPVDPLRLAFRGEEAGRLVRFPRPESQSKSRTRCAAIGAASAGSIRRILVLLPMG